jgi:RNA polymerase sigma factor (sigma-70 family)
MATFANREAIPGLTEILNGNKDEFLVLYNKYLQFVRCLVISLVRLRPNCETEDLVQDVMLKLVRGHFSALREFKGQTPEDFQGYLFLIVRNHCRTYWRRHSAELDVIADDYPQEALDEVDPDPEEEDDDDQPKFHHRFTSPVHSAMYRELWDLTLEAMEELPERENAVLQMKGLGMKDREIASDLGIPAGTVATSVNRGRKRLKEVTRQRYPVFEKQGLDAWLPG